MTRNVHIIAGPNGAGKTTFARKFLPLYADCRHFVNADLIAQGLSPFSPESAAVRAGRMVLSEIERLLSINVDFGFESTLSGRGYIKLLQRMRNAGYLVHIFFLWLPTVDAALARINERVLSGGHAVSPQDVRRRFDRSMRNFLTEYRDFADTWILFDNSEQQPTVIASKTAGELHIAREDLYANLSTRYGKEL